MPLRVLHVVPDLAFGAVTTRVVALCEHGPRDEFESRVATLRCSGGAQGRVLRAACSVNDLRARRACDPFALRRLRRLIGRERPDVVHAWGLVAGAYAAGAAPPGRLVVSWDPSTERASLGREGLARWTLRKGPRLLCDGGAAGGEPPWPAAALVPRAAAPAAGGVGDIREALGFPPGVRVIGVVSRLAPRKRVKELLWAADLVRVANESACFIVIGEGPERAALERFCRMACDPRRIRIVGARADAPAVIAQLDALWHAGDELSPPLAVLEAMAAGVPVVADSTRGARAAVTHGETGFLVSPGDRAERARATLRLLNDEPLRGEFATAAREDSQRRYPLAAMTEAYGDTYRQTVEQNAP